MSQNAFYVTCYYVIKIPIKFPKIIATQTLFDCIIGFHTKSKPNNVYSLAVWSWTNTILKIVTEIQ